MIIKKIQHSLLQPNFILKLSYNQAIDNICESDDWFRNIDVFFFAIIGITFEPVLLVKYNQKQVRTVKRA